MTGPAWRSRVRYLAAEPGWWGDTPSEHVSADRKRLGELTAQLGLAAGQWEQSLQELSTGERQRFALIRALQDTPPVLLLDEPTGALDAAAGRRVEEVLRQCLKAGAAIVLVSHSEEQVERLAQRRYAIRGRRLEEAP